MVHAKKTPARKEYPDRRRGKVAINNMYIIYKEEPAIQEFHQNHTMLNLSVHQRRNVGASDQVPVFPVSEKTVESSLCFSDRDIVSLPQYMDCYFDKEYPFFLEIRTDDSLRL